MKVKENKRLSITLGAIIIICIIACLMGNKKIKTEEINYQQYEKIINSNKKEIFSIGRPTCPHCVKFMPIIKEVSENLNIKINYINMDSFSKQDISKFYDSLEFFTKERWGTPLLIVVENKKVIASQIGYKDSKETKKFLEENK